MGVIAKGISRGCQGLFTPVSLGYPLSVFNKNSTLNGLVMEEISTLANRLFFVEFESTVRGSGDCSLCPKNNALKEFW